MAFDICMIATVKLVRPDELLSLIREAADLPGPLWFFADAARERHNVCFWHKADNSRLSSNVCFWGKADIQPIRCDVCFWHKADVGGSGLLPCKLITEPHSTSHKSLM